MSRGLLCPISGKWHTRKRVFYKEFASKRPPLHFRGGTDEEYWLG
jgi:hypothetical protein